MFLPLVALGKTLLDGVTGYFQRKQKIKEAVAENKARLARDDRTYNHEWEMRSLENTGWKDEVLFYGVIAMYIYSAIDPEGAAKVFANWEVIPEWFSKITMLLVASVVGIKKAGDYLPGLLKGVREAFKSDKED